MIFNTPHDKVIAEIAALRRTLADLPTSLSPILSEFEKLAAAPQPTAPPETVTSPADTAAVQDALLTLDDIKLQEAKTLQEFELIVEQVREAEAKLEIARNDHDAIQNQLKSASEEFAVLEDRRSQLNADLVQAATLVSQSDSIRAEMRELDARRAEMKSLEEEARLAKREGDGARQLIHRLWPAWLLDGSLANWKSELESRVFESNSPPSFGLLFAALHGYNAALRDPDMKSLYDSLRDIGRRLYPWLRDLGKSELQAAVIAESWADTINVECGGRSFIQVAVPGNPANNKWMIFTPTGGSSPDVANVRSWCVLDSQKRPIHRAEISV